MASASLEGPNGTLPANTDGVVLVLDVRPTPMMTAGWPTMTGHGEHHPPIALYAAPASYPSAPKGAQRCPKMPEADLTVSHCHCSGWSL
jgi:hypothetical protein